MESNPKTLFDEITDHHNLKAMQDLSFKEPQKKTDTTNFSSYKKIIRLQAQIDPDLQNIKSTKDLLKKIESVKEEQSKKCGYRADLFSRSWVPSKTVTAEEDEEKKTPKAQKKQASTNTNKLTSFTVMQFNTLAEGLSAGPEDIVKTPFDLMSDKNKKVKNCFGGFTSVSHVEDCLLFSNRKWRLLDVMLNSLPGQNMSLSSSSDDSFISLGADIIALEEVDRYHGFFEPALKHFGYSGIYIPKNLSPCIKLGWYSDGCALFFKKDIFKMVSLRQNAFSVGKQVYLVATLNHIESDKHMVVAVAHLKAKSDVGLDDVRRSQALELLQVVKEEVMKATNATSSTKTNNNNNNNNDDRNDVPVLFVGDFNAEPNGNGSSDEQKESSSTASLPCCLVDLPSDCMFSLQSCYDVTDMGKNDNSDTEIHVYSTWKQRGDKVVKRVIDYILYGKYIESSSSSSSETNAVGTSLECTHTLNIPQDECITKEYFPCMRHPSDHMSIGAKFIM